MSDNKKYYYLRVKENFYDSDELIILQGMPDGYLYSDILMKLYLRSLKNNGKLMFKDRIPYNATVLSSIVKHNVGVVEKALNLFVEMGLIEVLENGAIYMLDIQNYIGKSSTEADRKKQYRMEIENQKKLLTSGTNVRQKSGKCPDKNPPEIEIDLEKEIELDIEKEIELEGDHPNEQKPNKKTKKSSPPPFQEIINIYHEICTSYSKILTLTEERRGVLSDWYKASGIEEMKEVFTIAQKSDFLKGHNKRAWKADFDWIIEPNNRVKILEGRYDNKDLKQGKSQIDKFKNAYEIALEIERNRARSDQS